MLRKPIARAALAVAFAVSGVSAQASQAQASNATPGSSVITLIGIPTSQTYVPVGSSPAAGDVITAVGNLTQAKNGKPYGTFAAKCTTMNLVSSTEADELCEETFTTLSGSQLSMQSRHNGPIGGTPPEFQNSIYGGTREFSAVTGFADFRHITGDVVYITVHLREVETHGTR
ncbi:hypothetical protein ABZ845_29080 [Streptomyces sp. NPDC047022]|uniref:hypothetical protein n=1 Tax=Streptomyces sp. NPDC047022 TaxID=3155737 RepID=UPI0033CF71DB